MDTDGTLKVIVTDRAAISEKDGEDPVSTWYLRNLVGGRQLLDPVCARSG